MGEKKNLDTRLILSLVPLEELFVHLLLDKATDWSASGQAACFSVSAAQLGLFPQTVLLYCNQTL